MGQPVIQEEEAVADAFLHTGNIPIPLSLSVRTLNVAVLLATVRIHPRRHLLPTQSSTCTVCLIQKTVEGGEMAQGQELCCSVSTRVQMLSTTRTPALLWPLASHKHVHTHTCSHKHMFTHTYTRKA